jgi:transposase-like protein
MRCPYCEAEQVRPSKRSKTLDGLHAVFGRTPYRCQSCRRRFYSSGKDAAPAPAPAKPRSRGSRSYAWKARWRTWMTKRSGIWLRRVVLLALVVLALFLFFDFISTHRFSVSD